MQLYAYGKKISVSDRAYINTLQTLVLHNGESAIITPDLLTELVRINAVLLPSPASCQSSHSDKPQQLKPQGTEFGLGLAVGLII